MKKRIIKIILVIVWMLIIFLFSNQDASKSSNLSDSFIYKIVSIFRSKDISDEKMELIISNNTFIVRKAAHFFVYFVLGILVYLLLKEFKVNNIVIYSLLLCYLYAVSDEFHQFFIPGRSMEFRDTIIDSCGSFIGICFSRILNKKMIK